MYATHGAGSNPGHFEHRALDACYLNGPRLLPKIASRQPYRRLVRSCDGVGTWQPARRGRGGQTRKRAIDDGRVADMNEPWYR